MAIKRSERLQPVVRVTESREQDAARRLGESQKQLEHQQHQLQQLRAYREEYRRHLNANGQAGISASRLMEWRRFLGTLDQAVRQQEQAVALAEQERQQQRRAWLAARGRTQAIDQVVERCRSDEAKAADRREQKEADEIAQRRGPRGRR